MLDVAVIVAVQLEGSEEAGVNTACSGFVTLGTRVPQLGAKAAGCTALEFLLMAGTWTAEASFQVTESVVTPAASLFSVAVSVTAPAPEPKVVVLPALEETVTVIAFIVSASVLVFVVSSAEVAVIVAVQSAVIVFAGGVYVALVVVVLLNAPQPLVGESDQVTPPLLES
jgi:hypothetical protein